MAYTKTSWVNGSVPAISAENLNKMEEGIYENSNDIAALAALSLGQLELIWTNPNGSSQTSTMGATAITTEKATTLYSGFLIEFRAFYNSGEKVYGMNFTGMSGLSGYITAVKKSGNPVYIYRRTWYPSSATQITFSDCTRIRNDAADITGSDTGCLVPIRVWGIKVGV